MSATSIFGGRLLSLKGAGIMGALINLNHPAHVLKWHFIQLSVPNVVVIGVMLAVFALAIALPFPGARARSLSRRGEREQ